MFVVSKATGEERDDQTKNLVDYLNPGDALVLNNTKVVPARLLGKVATGGKVECLLLEPLGEGVQKLWKWEVLCKPGRRCVVGTKIHFDLAEGRTAIVGTIVDVLESGHRVLEFEIESKKENEAVDFWDWLEEVGKIPLPPYIRREEQKTDKELYQSVFAQHRGSVAAPTASLHLSQHALEQVQSKGVEIIPVTLHVGAGTFKPVKVDNILEHEMHGEQYSLTQESAERLNQVRKSGRKIWAVGTTAARVLETVATAQGGSFVGGEGVTHHYIYPGYKWQAVDGLLTNFHWPKSTLFMLVCSLLGVEQAQKSYQKAIEKQYRLFSYGDSMLIF